MTLRSLTFAFVLLASAGLADLVHAGVQTPSESVAGATRGEPIFRSTPTRAAIDLATEELFSVGDGVVVVETEAGLGLVACASATFDPDATSLDLLALDRRRAGAEAALRARSHLVAWTDGIEVSSIEETLRAFALVSNASTNHAVGLETARERVVRLTEGLVRGAILQDVRVDERSGRISVCVATTPSTRSSSLALSSRALLVDDVDAAEARLERELSVGVTLPDGATVLVDEREGRIRWIGHGSALLTTPPSTDPSLAAMMAEDAERRAALRSEAALMKALHGEDVQGKEVVDGRFARLSTMREDLLGGFSETDEFTASISASATTLRSAASGELPSTTRRRTGRSDDGLWVHVLSVVDVVPPSRAGAAQPAVVEDGGAPTGRTGARPDPPRPAALEPTPECGLAAREGHRLVRATGVAATRARAVALALGEAVRSANGVVLSSSSVVRQQFTDAVSDLDGKLTRLVEVEGETEDEVRTSTNGMVTAFQILGVQERPESGTTRVDICALVPVFDPARPRPGRRPTIAVLPFETSTDSFEFSGARITATSVAEAIGRDLVSMLVAADEFTVIDREHLDLLEGELAKLAVDLERGRVDPAEKVKLGRLLGADYVVVGKIEQFFHRRWMEYVPVRRTEEERELLSVESRCRLLSVTTGAIETTDDFARTWTLPDLSPDRLGPEDARLTRDALARSRVIAAHSEALLGALRTLGRARHPRFIAAVARDEVVLKYAGSDYAVGDELTVRGIRRVPLDGGVEEIEVEKGVVRVVRVDRTKGHIYAEVVSGDVDDFETGDACRP